MNMKKMLILAVAAIQNNGSESSTNEILIAPGTYSIAEMIQIPWYRLRIRSAKLENVEEEDPENAILDGGGTTSIMKWTGDNTYVSGLTFANGFSTNEQETTGECRQCLLYRLNFVAKQCARVERRGWLQMV